MATPLDPFGLLGLISDANQNIRIAVQQGTALYTVPDPPDPPVLSNPTPDLSPDNTYKPHEIYIIDVENQERLRIQNVPLELDYNPESTFAAINTIGRNNPFYHYTGSEDTLTFDLSWYGEESDRTDVIKKCRWLESFTKNNAYDHEPHRVILSFGTLFENCLWLITAAPYKMSLYHKQFGMLPTLAYQSITMKRVVEKNLTWKEIRAYPTVYVSDGNIQTDQPVNEPVEKKFQPLR